MLELASQVVADLSEDLAIEILAEFQAEDLTHLSKTLNRLEAAEGFLTQMARPVPAAVQELLRHYRAM